MKDQVLEFSFDGPDAQADAQALADFLKSVLPDWPARVAQREPPPKVPGTRDAGTTVALIALALSAPGALKDAFDLADRLKLKQKLERLIAWAKDRRARRQQNPFVVLPPHGLKVPLDQAKPEQLFDAITGAGGPGKPPKP